MSNEIQSPAARLAAVLRVVARQSEFEVQGDKVCRVSIPNGYLVDTYNPASKDDLARIVGMLDGEQLKRFNGEIGAREVWTHDLGGSIVGQEWEPLEPHEIIAAPTFRWLEALAAAAGVGDQQEETK